MKWKSSPDVKVDDLNHHLMSVTSMYRDKWQSKSSSRDTLNRLFKLNLFGKTKLPNYRV